MPHISEYSYKITEYKGNRSYKRLYFTLHNLMILAPLPSSSHSIIFSTLSFSTINETIECELHAKFLFYSDSEWGVDISYKLFHLLPQTSVQCYANLTIFVIVDARVNNHLVFTVSLRVSFAQF